MSTGTHIFKSNLKVLETDFYAQPWTIEDEQTAPLAYLEIKNRGGVLYFVFGYYDRIGKRWVIKPHHTTIDIEPGLECTWEIRLQRDRFFIYVNDQLLYGLAIENWGFQYLASHRVVNRRAESSMGIVRENRGVEIGEISYEYTEDCIGINRLSQTQPHFGVEVEFNVFAAEPEGWRLVQPQEVQRITGLVSRGGNIQNDNDNNLEVSTFPVPIDRPDLTCNYRNELFNRLLTRTPYRYFQLCYEYNVTPTPMQLSFILSGQRITVPAFVSPYVFDVENFGRKPYNELHHYEAPKPIDVEIDSGLLNFMVFLYRFLTQEGFNRLSFIRGSHGLIVRPRVDFKGIEVRVKCVNDENFVEYTTLLAGAISIALDAYTAMSEAEQEQAGLLPEDAEYWYDGARMQVRQSGITKPVERKPTVSIVG